MSFTTALGYGVQAYSAYEEGKMASVEDKAQDALSNYNAEVAEQNAKAIEAKTTFDQLRALRRGRKITGTLRAGLGASGALMSEGAPARLVAEQEFENALENALIGYEGRMEASRQISAANLLRHEAKTYKMKARNLRRAGYMKAGTTLLSGFTSMYGQGMFERGTGSRIGGGANAKDNALFAESQGG